MTTARTKTPQELRSARWFAPDDLRAFGHRSRAMQMGYGPEDWVGKPVIAILNTWSEAQPCHMHFKSRVDDVKRGILQAGGFPMELPALSLSESFLKPTTMLYRNLLAMDAEELLRGHPVDGVVLMGGCDKTTPGPAAGRDQHGHPGDLPARRADAARQLEGQGAGLGLRRLEVLGRAPRRQDLRRGLGRRRGRHRPQLRHLHDHGHGRDHDGDGRDARHVAARRLVDPGGRRQPHPHGRRDRPAHRRHGVGGPDAEEDPDQGRLPQRHHRGDGGRLLDQRHHPPDRAGPPRRPRGCRARRLRARQPQGAGDRQHPAVGRQVPDGGFLLRRRPARPAGADPRSPASRRDDRHRQDAGREREGRGDLQRRRDPPGREPDLQGRRARGAEGQPRARRLRDQAERLCAQVPEAHRAGAGVRRLSVDEGRDRSRRSRRHRGHRADPAQCRPAGRAGHAGMGHAADPQEAGEAGRARHGAAQRQPHERHQLRRLHPARLARELHRRAAGAGEDRRHDLARRRQAHDRHERVRRGAGRRRKAAWKQPEARYERGYGWMFTRHIKQANEGCDFDFLETSFGAPVAEPSIY